MATTTAAAVEANPPPLNNWNHSVITRPAVILRAKTVEDVQAAVRGGGDGANAAQFPSPVLAVGSAHTVTDALRNDGGTMVDVSALNAILGLDKVAGQDVVRVQCGVKLAALHRWLDERNKEISFSPEIGDATVGSIVGSTSKDSSIQGPGFFSALVASATWVDDKGQLRTASLEDADPTPLRQITCAYGLMGIIVEAALLIRTHTLVRTVMGMHPCPGSAAEGAPLAARILSKARSECDNMFVIMHPCRDQIYTEQRWLVSGRTRVPPLITAANLKILGTPKALCFKRGKPLPSFLTPVVSLNRHMKLSTLHRRYGFTNSYSAVTDKESRLDFSYFEFDLSRFDEVVQGCWEFAAEYERRANFTPSGFAMYFVERPGDRLAGNYTGAKGTSFMLDPIHHDPSCAKWQKFNEAYNHWAVANGANVSLTQTKGLTPQLGGLLPQSLARERFVTPFFRAFLVDDDGDAKAAALSYARPLGDEHPRRAELLAEMRRLVDEAEVDNNDDEVGATVEVTAVPLATTPTPTTPPKGGRWPRSSRMFGGLALFGGAGWG